MNQSKTGVLVSLLLWGLSASAAVQTLSAKGGQVEILAMGRPAFIRIQGVGSAPQGNIQLDGRNIKGEFEFDLASLDTGIKMRNEHMKTKYLEVDKYPRAKLVIESATLSKDWSVKNPDLKSAEFSGNLTLHGVTRPVKGTFSMGADRDVLAEFDVKLSDYQVAVPSFAGITVKDDVSIKVKIAAMDLK